MNNFLQVLHNPHFWTIILSNVMKRTSRIGTGSLERSGHRLKATLETSI